MMLAVAACPRASAQTATTAQNLPAPLPVQPNDCHSEVPLTTSKIAQKFVETKVGSLSDFPKIEAALMQIRDAAIASEPGTVAPLLAENLALVSQSGKLYGKEAALFDLRNGFTAWENSDTVVREQGDTAVVTLVNRRTRTGMKPAQFRVMQIWRKQCDGWVMIAQSSAAMKQKGAPAIR